MEVFLGSFFLCDFFWTDERSGTELLDASLWTFTEISGIVNVSRSVICFCSFLATLETKLASMSGALEPSGEAGTTLIWTFCIAGGDLGEAAAGKPEMPGTVSCLATLRTELAAMSGALDTSGETGTALVWTVCMTGGGVEEADAD